MSKQLVIALHQEEYYTIHYKYNGSMLIIEHIHSIDRRMLFVKNIYMKCYGNLEIRKGIQRRREERRSM